MQVNSALETKKIERTKFSLSLNRNNATRLIEEDRNQTTDSKENSLPGKVQTSCLIQDRPPKRPFNSTYFNTLNAAKKLKTVTETLKPAEPKLVILNPAKFKRPELAQFIAMLNGDHPPDQYGSNGTSTAASSKKMPIATLSNLGNTCFLNSVLYTLRYAPRFLHNLHHLVSDLSSVEQKLGSVRLKSSSLGRSAAGLASSGTRSWSSKDLLSLGQSDSNTGKSKIQIATERLHETYASLRSAETKCLNGGADASPEPYAADAFLSALRDVNSTFEGNRQQDAHELLICILNNIRETCRALAAKAARLQIHENGESNGLTRQPSLDSDASKPTLGNLRKSWKKRRAGGKAPEPLAEPESTPAAARAGWDFVQEDFEGVMVMRTTCMECETVREHRQAMSDVCVPVSEDGDPCDQPYMPALAAECLRDQNKYWCGTCLRYVEARRGAGYARLPRLLVLQLKRFSGGMTKITRHAPTPPHMPCFCEPCAAAPHAPKHRYNLWAVIMHLGQTLTGGHYVAYARDCSPSSPEPKCERDGEDNGAIQTSSNFMKTLFNRPRPQQHSGCAAKECCVPRPREAGWLACDDELVKPISNEEFEDLLSAEPKMRSAATPYLLFYVKSEVG